MEQGLAGQSCWALPQAAGTGQGHPGPTDPVQRQPPKQQRGRVPGRHSARNIPILLLTSTLWLYLGSETEPVQLQTEAAARAAGRKGQGIIVSLLSLCPLQCSGTVQPHHISRESRTGAGQRGWLGAGLRGSTSQQDRHTEPSARTPGGKRPRAK